MHRRTLLKSAAASVVAAVPLTSAVLTPAAAAPVRGRTLASGLNYPWGLDFLPDGSALVTERNSGRVLRVPKDGSPYDVVGTVETVNSGGEDGCLGLAVSPTFAAERSLHIYHSTESDNRVSVFTYDEGTGLSAGTPILTGIPHGRIHNGGGLLHTAGKGLFVTCGEAGNGPLAQDRSSLGGKILRIRPDGSPWPDNPFIDKAGDDRIFSIGHRNPQGIALAKSGQVWAAELGQNSWDELNQVSPGRNYGWPRSEGKDGAGVGYSDPFVQWHPVDCSPSGLAIRHGYAWIGALRGQSLWRVDIYGSGRRHKTRFFHKRFGRVRNVKLAPDDTLWITTSNGGGTDRVITIAFR